MNRSRRGPYAKTAGRIECILDAALDLFATNGYRSTTMREVAERAGISQPGLVHHFPTKADVMLALLRRRDERCAARLARAAGTLPPVDRLLAFADDIRGQCTETALHCVLSAEATAADHPAHDYFKDRRARLVASMTTGFAELQRQGAVRPDADPATLARTLLALLDGLRLQWLYDPSAVDIRAELEVFVRSWSVDQEDSRVASVP